MAHTHESPPHTPINETMIDECPVVDIHAHVPGTVAPQLAWELGLRNDLIRMKRREDGMWKAHGVPHKLGTSDPAGNYLNIFTSKGNFELSFDSEGKPIDLDYNYNCLGQGHDKFSGFDAVLATVQGLRHPPGGIQTPDDYRLVLDNYLQDCLKQNVRYTEVLQNVHLSHVIYGALDSNEEGKKEARRKFFKLCQEEVAKFAEKGVTLRFHHCPNKTSSSNLPGTLAERSAEWPKWLEEAHKVAPGVFVALNSAGNEKKEKKEGGPDAMSAAYQHAHDSGFGGEAHAGEGIGVEHMVHSMRVLNVSRLAHGVQAIESQEAINEVRARNITLIMMPCINIALGSTVHLKKTATGFVPAPKFLAIDKRDGDVSAKHILKLEDHPFFPLLREHKLAIALASDDPLVGGVPYRTQLRQLAGIDYRFAPGFKPLSAEELALCNLNAIDAAFCSAQIKQAYVKELSGWMAKYYLKVDHHLLNEALAKRYSGESSTATERPQIY